MLQVENKEQVNLFEDENEEPQLGNLGVTASKLKGSQLSLTIECVTNVNDMGLLGNSAWRHGVAEWLLTISGGSTALAIAAIQNVRKTSDGK